MQVFTMLPVNDWNQTGSAARAAETAGFDALMTVEAKHDPFLPLAVAALATKRIALTTSVAVAFPRSPAVTAMQAWDRQFNRPLRARAGQPGERPQ
jgi:alkanesulfonate monooxygenase SsuD/methylene tetrahydromethanopterin reductase-like flavin-dependent oxidoreductase (luciferase family)